MRYEDLVKPGFLSIEDAKRTARDRRSFVLRNRIEQVSDLVDGPVDRDGVEVAPLAPRAVELPVQKIEQVCPRCGADFSNCLDVQEKDRFERVQFGFRKFKLLFKGQWHRFLHRFVGTVDGKERPAREEEKTTPRRGRDQTGGA